MHGAKNAGRSMREVNEGAIAFIGRRDLVHAHVHGGCWCAACQCPRSQGQEGDRQMSGAPRRRQSSAPQWRRRSRRGRLAKESACTSAIGTPGWAWQWASESRRGVLNGAQSERLVVSSGRLLTATCGKYHVMEIHASESVRALQGCHLVVKLRMVDSTTCPQRLCIYK